MLYTTFKDVQDVLYDGNILQTNFKRWNKNCKMFNYVSQDSYIKSVNIFYIFITILKVNPNSNLLNNFKNINQMLNKNNYYDFVVFALDNYKPGILEKLNEIKDYDIKSDILKTHSQIFIKKIYR